MAKPLPSAKTRSRHAKLRTSIYQASWNYQYRDTFPTIIMFISVLAGLWFESWWVFLGCFFFLATLPDFSATVGLLSLVWGFGWAALISIPIGLNFSLGAAVTAAVIVFSISYVPLRSSEQYWRDLEKDGGPYSD